MSALITLPKWLTRTQSMQFNSVDVVLIKTARRHNLQVLEVCNP